MAQISGNNPSFGGRVTDLRAFYENKIAESTQKTQITPKIQLTTANSVNGSVVNPRKMDHFSPADHPSPPSSHANQACRQQAENIHHQVVTEKVVTFPTPLKLTTHEELHVTLKTPLTMTYSETVEKRVKLTIPLQITQESEQIHQEISVTLSMPEKKTVETQKEVETPKSDEPEWLPTLLKGVETPADEVDLKSMKESMGSMMELIANTEEKDIGQAKQAQQLMGAFKEAPWYNALDEEFKAQFEGVHQIINEYVGSEEVASKKSDEPEWLPTLLKGVETPADEVDLNSMKESMGSMLEMIANAEEKDIGQAKQAQQLMGAFKEAPWYNALDEEFKTQFEAVQTGINEFVTDHEITSKANELIGSLEQAHTPEEIQGILNSVEEVPNLPDRQQLLMKIADHVFSKNIALMNPKDRIPLDNILSEVKDHMTSIHNQSVPNSPMEQNYNKFLDKVSLRELPLVMTSLSGNLSKFVGSSKNLADLRLQISKEKVKDTEGTRAQQSRWDNDSKIAWENLKNNVGKLEELFKSVRLDSNKEMLKAALDPYRDILAADNPVDVAEEFYYAGKSVEDLSRLMTSSYTNAYGDSTHLERSIDIGQILVAHRRLAERDEKTKPGFEKLNKLADQFARICESNANLFRTFNAKKQDPKAEITNIKELTEAVVNMRAQLIHLQQQASEITFEKTPVGKQGALSVENFSRKIETIHTQLGLLNDQFKALKI